MSAISQLIRSKFSTTVGVKMLTRLKRITIPSYDIIHTSRNHLKKSMMIAMKKSIKKNEDNQYFYILSLDLDRFKNINLCMGHLFGDQLIEQVALRLKTAIGNNFMARTGDDEFLLLFHVTSASAFENIVKTIKHLFVKSFIIDGQPCYVNISLGACLVDADLSMIEQSLKMVDQALSAAKQQGKNKLVMYDEALYSYNTEHLRMETDLREAILSNQLVLHYQPRLELATGKIICLEALVRWNHPVKGLIQPNEFIPLAEESGLILELGTWVLNNVCTQKKQWLDAGMLDFQISVNISPKQFQEQEFAEKIFGIIQKTGVLPAHLELEITESSVMQDMNRTILIMQKLYERGLSISIDDFGSGYSSLKYLKLFPIQCLKIDRSFVKNIQNSPSDLAITHAIINLGHSLNLQVVAEGVEEISQLDILKQNKCNTIQGFLLSPPISAKDLEKLLVDESMFSQQAV